MASSEEVDDDTPVDNVCPICMEVFRQPKLLLCRHTFCASCLDNLIATKSEKTKFPCPICRNQIKLSKSGVDGLLSNYFVACAPEMQKCNICDGESKGKLLRCDVCLRKTCVSCYISHRENSKSCSKSEDEVDPFSGQLYRMLRGSNNNPRTAYEAIKTAQFVYEQVPQIRKVLPLNGHKAWVACRNNPYVVQFDGDGNVLQKLAVNKSVMDMCFHPNGSLLFTYEGSNSVMMYGNSGESVFTKVRETSEIPTCITAVKDDTIVVATRCTNTLHESSHLLYFDSEGNFIHKLDTPTFKKITALCFNAATNKVCVADEKKGRIILVGSEGRYQTYFGSDRLTIRRGSHHHGRGFRPKTLTCDSDGSTWSYDGNHRMVHILNNSALLVALFDTNDIIGEPNHMSFAQNGELWMSDTDLSTIKIYIVERCANRLGRGSDEVVDDSDEECGVDEENGSLTINLSDLSPEALEQVRRDMENRTSMGRVRLVGRRSDMQQSLMMQLHEMNNMMLRNITGNTVTDDENLRAIMEAMRT